MAPNLDKHPLYPSRYIAYDAQGFAFKVRQRPDRTAWTARPGHAGAATDTRWFSARLLREVAALVAASSRVELPADDSGLRNFA